MQDWADRVMETKVGFALVLLVLFVLVSPLIFGSAENSWNTVSDLFSWL